MKKAASSNQFQWKSVKFMHTNHEKRSIIKNRNEKLLNKFSLENAGGK